MAGIFHPDSKLMRLMTGITNLVCLNLLWIICCIPIITAGAATTAMYSVLFAYITGQDDAVLKPFFRAFRNNFRQATSSLSGKRSMPLLFSYQPLRPTT